MKGRVTDLRIAIEKTRKAMVAMYEQKRNLLSPEVLKLSQQLDEQLNTYTRMAR